MSTVLSWSNLQRELTESYRVVSYDRAGLGWSDLGPMPRTADRIVDELHRLLQQAAIPPPYVLVGHSFGGLTMPLFAARFPEEVAGMVLVDPVAPSEWNPPSEHDRKLTRDRKSTRLNSSHQIISYAVFCLKKKNDGNMRTRSRRLALFMIAVVAQTNNLRE